MTSARPGRDTILLPLARRMDSTLTCSSPIGVRWAMAKALTFPSTSADWRWLALTRRAVPPGLVSDCSRAIAATVIDLPA